MLERSFVSPPYTAVIEWEATASVVVAKDATPLAIVPVPMVVAPSLKVTVPDAVAGETVAVNVTNAPKVDGLGDDVSAVAVGAWPMTSETTVDVLPWSFASPL